MGNKSQIGMAIHLQKTYYLPGQLVQGNIYINCLQATPCCKIIMNVTGKQTCSFRNDNRSVSTQHRNNGITPDMHKKLMLSQGEQRGQCKILQQSYVLISWQKQQKLFGQYVFPFVFKLPSYLPGSFKQQKSNYYASICYLIRATCLSYQSKIAPISTEIELIIRQPQRSKQQSMYGEIFVYPETCCYKKHGVSKVCCYFQKYHFTAGEQCIAICEVDNYKCSLALRQVKIKFIKKLTLTSGFGLQHEIIKQVNSVSFPGIEANEMYIGPNAKKIILPLKYKTHEILHPSTQGRLIKCEYFLQVTPIFSGACVVNDNFFRISLNILQAGIVQEQIERPEQWDPQVFKRSQIIFEDNQMENPHLKQMWE